MRSFFVWKHEHIAYYAYPCYNTGVMSIQEANLSGWDGVGDGVLARLRAAKTEQAPLPMAASVDQNTASPHWPMWRGFLYGLREGVDRPAYHTDAAAAREAAALRAESAATLRHMASGEFWGDQAGQMHPVDLASAKKTAAEFVERYNLGEEATPAPRPADPGEKTQPIPAASNSGSGRHHNDDQTRVVRHPASLAAESPTRPLDLTAYSKTAGSDEKTGVISDSGAVTERLSATALTGAINGVRNFDTPYRNVGERPGVIGGGHPTTPGEKTYDFGALHRDLGERTVNIASPGGPGEMTQAIPPVADSNIVGLDTLLNSAHQVHKI
jgi:hypothetical protein